MAHISRRFKSVVAMLGTAALTLTACGGGSGSEQAAPGDGTGTLTAAVAYATTNYHPSNTSSALAMGTNWHVVEGLWEQDMSDYSVYKALSKDDEPKKISDTQYEITLRDGAKFSDGSDVTAEDVVKSFERSMKKGNLYASMLSFVDSVTAKDDKTVTLKLKAPFALMKQRLAIVKIVPAKATDEQLTSMPIGSGPYKYESITDAQVKAVKNEHYNGDKPATNATLVWDVLIDDTARTTAAQSGSADVIENVPAENVGMLESAGMKVEEKDGFNLPFLIFNTEKKPFNDERVRQAFHYAINTQMLIDNNMDGKAKAATSFLPESHPNYHKAATQFNFDPEKAKSLLKEAGAENLSITLLTTDHTWIESLSPQIKNNLEAIGVKVNLQAQASASLYADNLDVDNPTYDVALAPGDPSVFGNDPALLIDWWYGDNVWTQKRSFFQKSNPEVFEKIRKLMDESVSLTGEQQQAKWNEAMDIIAEQAAIYPLFHRTMLTASNTSKISNFKPISTTGLWLLGATSNQ